MQRSLLKGPLIIIFALLSLNVFGAKLPDIKVANEFGVPGTLSSHLEEKTLLVMGFYHCKHICHFVAKNLSQQLRKFSTYPKVVFFSIDETEGPRDAITLRKRIVGPDKDRWSFLVADEGEIKKLVKALNFEMKRDPVSGTITHEMGIYGIRDGEVVSKMSDIIVNESDLKFEKSDSHMDAVKKFCAEFDPRKSKYGVLIINSLSAACLLFLAVAAFSFFRIRRRS